MIATLRVLSIGSPETAWLVRDALILRTRCRLFVAARTGDLSVVSASEEIDVAILHDELPRCELRGCATSVRRRWPHARILLIQDKDESLTRGMYDESVTSAISHEPLLAAIERLGACARRQRRLIADPGYTLSTAEAGQRQTAGNHTLQAGRPNSWPPCSRRT